MSDVIAWCFLSRVVSPAEVTKAVLDYEVLEKKCRFAQNAGSLIYEGEGFGISIHWITGLKLLLAVIAQVPERKDELRKKVMALEVRVTGGKGTYKGTSYEASAAGGGPALQSIPEDALFVCEALNIQLQSARPLVYDRTAGFYPSV